MDRVRMLRLPKVYANAIRNFVVAANGATDAQPYRVSRSVEEKQNFVNGHRIKPEKSNRHFPVYEPATGSTIIECPNSSAEDVNVAVQAAKTAFCNWSNLSAFERARVLRKTGELIKENLSEIAYLEVRNNGKPIYEARMDIAGCADTFLYYAGVAPAFVGEHIPLGASNFAYTTREPLGVVAGIGAWNYPFQTMSWKCAPALACGNTFVYKPSPLTPLTAVVLAEILTEAGLPAGAINVVQGEVDTGEALCTHPNVAKVSFTGSVPTGQRIMQLCATNGLRPVTLELGGKSPLVIFEDCDLDNAVKGAMLANFLTQGQVCSNAARVYVHRSILSEFTDKVVKRTLAMKIGDPFAEETTVGATISMLHMEKIQRYIESAKQEGATVLCGGDRIIPADAKLKAGYFISPCVITDVTDGMRVCNEEIFGAVMCILPFDTEEEVIKRANDTPFGLSAGLFTNNLQRAHRIAGKLQAGSVWVNTYNAVPVEVPFGGVKMSGFGRENGMAALNCYSQVKSVTFDLGNVLNSPI